MSSSGPGECVEALPRARKKWKTNFGVKTKDAELSLIGDSIYVVTKLSIFKLITGEPALQVQVQVYTHLLCALLHVLSARLTRRIPVSFPCQPRARAGIEGTGYCKHA